MIKMTRNQVGLTAVMFLCFSFPALAQVDLSGSWASKNHEDALERGAGPNPEGTGHEIQRSLGSVNRREAQRTVGGQLGRPCCRSFPENCQRQRGSATPNGT